MSIRFGEHPSFHKAAAGMVGGSALFAAALTPITPLAALAGGILGVGLGASVAYGKPWRMGIAAVATIPMFAMGPLWGALAAGASLLSLALVIGGPRGMKGLAALGLGAVLALVAMWCAVKIGTAQKTQFWPPLAQNLAAAAAMGMVGVLATLPRHLGLASDPVAAALKALPTNLDAEVRELCTRSVAIWTTASDKLDTSNQQLVRDGVLKALEVAAKSAEVKVSASGGEDLAKRITDLDARIAAATDDEVKSQYTAAKASLEDQLRYRARIAQNRERLVARMHNHVAALEKFQLAATGLEVSRATNATALGQLAELSQNVAASGEALAEVELTAPSSAN